MPEKVLKNTSADLGLFMESFRQEVIDTVFGNAGARDAAEYVLMELINNAQEHGNRYDESKSVTVRWKVETGKLWLSVMDEGGGFVPVVPDAPPGLESPRGRGLWAVARETEKLKFNRKGNKVSVWLEVNDG